MKTVFMVMGQIAVKRGGITRVLLDRATLFANNGYKVKVLTLTWDANLEQTVSDLKAHGRVDERVEFIDAHDFFVLNESDMCSSSSQELFALESNLFEKGYKIDLDNFEKDLKAIYYQDNTLAKVKGWRKGANQALALDWVLRPGLDEAGTFSIFYPHLEGKVTYKVSVAKEANNICDNSFLGADGQVRIMKPGRPNEQITVFPKKGLHRSFGSNDEFLGYLIEYICEKEEYKPIVIVDGFHWAPVAGQVSKIVADVVVVSHFSHLEPMYKSKAPVLAIHNKNFYHQAFKEYDKYAALVVLTEEQKQDILNVYPNIKNLFVIPNCIPASRLLKSCETVDKDCLKAVCITRLSPEKNVKALIYAFAKVVAKNKQATLDIYGDGDIAEQLMQVTKRLGLEKNIFFKGYVMDVNRAYQSALVSVLTSKSEGHPLALLESMLNEVPVISYSCKYGPKEIITGNIDGFLLEPDDIEGLAQKLLFAFAHAEELISMGKVAKKSIMQKFSEEAHLEHWKNLFNTVRCGLN